VNLVELELAISASYATNGDGGLSCCYSVCAADARSVSESYVSCLYCRNVA